MDDQSESSTVKNTPRFSKTRLLGVKKHPKHLVITMLAFAVVGGAALMRSYAQSIFISASPETGTITAPATVVDDSSAVGGKYVQFASAGSGGGGTGGTVTGTAYYVDCTNGNDVADGKSQAAAWKTLSRANSATLNSGDGLKLKNGCTFNNDQLIAKWNGTATSNVIIDSYDGTNTNAPILQRNTNGAVISVTGSYITINNLSLNGIAPSRTSSTDAVCPNAPIGNIQGVTFESTAHHGTVRNSIMSGFYAGVYVKSGAHHNNILANTITDNIMMSPLDSANTNNDAGAFGVLLHGDDNEVANNQISGSNSCSYDYVRDGAAIEVYGGQRNNTHNNKATNNDAFAELGNSRTADNRFAFNLVSSNLTRSIFLVTRGPNDTFGPVSGTKAYNNTVYLTGSTSQGIVCYAGCSTLVLSARNNILWANKSLYSDGAFDESNNIYWKTGGNPTIQNAGGSTVSGTSKKADPLFVNITGSDFHLQSGSPARDSGDSSVVAVGALDLDNRVVPSGSAVDIGGYEYGAVAPTASVSGSRSWAGRLVTAVSSTARTVIRGIGSVMNKAASTVQRVYASVAPPKVHAQAAGSFTFGATGDHASDSTTTPIIRAIGASGTRPNFFVSLGDLSYGNKTEADWCKYIKDNINGGAGQAIGSSFGETFPFQMITGGHENGIDNVGHGVIDNFVQCLPDRSGSTISPHGGTAITGSSPLGTGIPSITGGPTYVTNNYGKEYYFDYPAGAPKARLIFTSPKQPLKYGGLYDYSGSLDAAGNPVSTSSTRYKWLASAIDSARAAGIKWVIVGNHENYITMGIKADEVGVPYFNLLVAKKVDLVLQGHDHNYQRSKQLVHGSGCTSISATVSANAACTVEYTGSTYTKGKGSLLIINGSGGHGHYATNSADSQAPYFVANDSVSYGYTKYTVSDSEIVGTYVATSGSFSDSFTIRDTSAPTVNDTNPPTASITSPINNSSVSGTIDITATATDNVGVAKVELLIDGAVKSTVTQSPYNFKWNSAEIPNGAHSIQVKAYDPTGNAGSSSAITVVVNNGCAPTVNTYGSTSVAVSVPQSGVYHLWSRIMVPDTTNNSYTFQTTNTCNVTVGDASTIPVNQWVWIDYRDGASTTKADLTLTAGTHTLTLAGREPGVRVDQVLLLSDACIPTGTGDNCTATPDTTAPIVSVSSPLNGQNVNGPVSYTVAARDDGGSGVAKVEFYVNNALQITDTTSPHGFTWETGGLQPGAYTLYVRAYDGAGNTTQSASISVNVTDVTAPVVNVTVPVEGTQVSNTVSVGFSATDNVGLVRYDFYVDDVKSNFLDTSALSGNFSWDTTTVTNDNHRIQVRGADAAGNVGESKIVTVKVLNDMQPPTAPANLTATVISSTRVDLAWSASTDDTSVMKYLVQRDGIVITEILATSATAYGYQDLTVTALKSYAYTVYAVDTANRTSVGSTSATVSTPAVLDTTAPTAPTNLTASLITSSSVTLTWGPSTDTGGSGLAGYRIFRNDAVIASVGANINSFGDGTVQPTTTYSYKVIAFDGSNNVSQPSNVISVPTKSLPTTDTIILTPTADATIAQRNASSNYGTSQTVGADKSPVHSFLMKFSVSGINGRKVASAKLQMYVKSKSNNGGSFYQASNSTWSESTVTWNNAPATTSLLIGNIGTASAGVWKEVDVTSLVTGDGTVSLRTTSSSTDGIEYSSKEAPTNKPRLVIMVTN